MRCPAARPCHSPNETRRCKDKAHNQVYIKGIYANPLATYFLSMCAIFMSIEWMVVNTLVAP